MFNQPPRAVSLPPIAYLADDTETSSTATYSYESDGVKLSEYDSSSTASYVPSSHQSSSEEDSSDQDSTHSSDNETPIHSSHPVSRNATPLDDTVYDSDDGPYIPSSSDESMAEAYSDDTSISPSLMPDNLADGQTSTEDTEMEFRALRVVRDGNRIRFIINPAYVNRSG
ncbi:hypothetical protein RSAG8_08817, partial [Rhizoctonia solani AG-8 WAC10335]